MDTISEVLTPIHKEGHRFIAIFAVIALILFSIWTPLGWLGVVATLWCAYFFRDPDRVTPSRPGLVIAPADGRISRIGPGVPPAELEMGPEPRTCISIFMNVFNCHVNRVPMDGTIAKVAYRPGAFLNASLDKASEENERQALRLTTADGKDIAFVQIAGLVARRIVTDVRPGQTVAAGERFGLIRFGSRVDVYLPDGVQPLVVLGQTTIAGESVLADFNSSETARMGDVR